MDNHSRIIGDILPLLTDADREEIAEQCLAKVDKVFANFGYTVVKKHVIPPQVAPKPTHKRKDRIGHVFNVNGRSFKSKKKAAEFYGVNYHTAITKLNDGIDPEEVFDENTIIKRKMLNGGQAQT